MKALPRILAVSTLALTLTGGVALAQDHGHDEQAEHHQQYVRHSEWRKGAHVRDEDWRRGEQVDWHAHHLRRPPNGYEWREIDGNYVMANSSGVIFSVVIARH
ncbi:MAG TPA: RcnB family protein [Terracidiphilus sp.]|nr:RcnB family protein [Terracidiphilus sp.]